MGSDIKINISSFVQTGSGIKTLIGRGDSQTYRKEGYHISLLSLFLNKEGIVKRNPR